MGSAVSSIAGSVGNLAGGIVGDIASGGDRGQAKDFTNEAVGALQGVQTPTDLANLINYQKYQSAGTLTPAQEQMIAASPSLQAAVKANPQLVAAQMQALNQLQQTSKTGMSATDQARLNQIQQQLNSNAQGQKQAAMQNFAQRGQAGSGNELLAELNAGQNAANQANQSGLGVAANAQQNALSALSQYGNQAGQMNQQQYGQQSQAAQAADALNRFNVQNQMQQQARNVASQNQAQAVNLQNAQGISNANTSQGNQALNMQRQGEQQQFQDALSKATGVSNAEFTGANAYNNMANQTANMYGNIGSGIGAMGGGAATAFGGSGGSSSGGGGGAANAGTSGNYDSSANPFSAYAAHGGEINYADGGLTSDSLTGSPGNGSQQKQQGSGGSNDIGDAMSLISLLSHGGQVCYADGGQVDPGGLLSQSLTKLANTKMQQTAPSTPPSPTAAAPGMPQAPPAPKAAPDHSALLNQYMNSGKDTNSSSSPQPTPGGPGMYAAIPAGRDPFASLGPQPGVGDKDPTLAPGYSFGGHVPKSEDAHVMTSGNGFDSPNNNCYFVGGNVTGNQKPEDFNPLLGPALQHQDTDMNNPIMKMLPMITKLASHGGHVPGKAKVPGKVDSYSNDTIPARLSPGEIVIPRSITQGDDPAEKAKWFVKKIKEEKH